MQNTTDNKKLELLQHIQMLQRQIAEDSYKVAMLERVVKDDPLFSTVAKQAVKTFSNFIEQNNQRLGIVISQLKENTEDALPE